MAESPISAETCTTFYLTLPINIDLYCAEGAVVPQVQVPATPIDGALPAAPAIPWSFTALPPGATSKIYYVDGHLVVTNLVKGITTIRAATVSGAFKVQDVVFRVWPAGKTIADPDASMEQTPRARPESTTGWGGTIKERRGIFTPTRSSGNK
jgi:hypothetical protein